MNKKGFTLVELIATIVLMSLVLGIGGYSVVGIINNAKNKNEEIFVKKISVAIDEYISLYGSSFVDNDVYQEYTIYKCKYSSCNDNEESKREVFVDEIYAPELENGFKLSVLLEENLFSDNKLINPVNKLNCLEDGKDPIIRVFKDSDYVYYYYVDLREGNTSCDISSENGIISTLPDDDDFKQQIGVSDEE